MILLQQKTPSLKTSATLAVRELGLGGWGVTGRAKSSTSSTTKTKR